MLKINKEKKQIPDEEKKKNKNQKEEINRQYVYAIVDGNFILSQILLRKLMASKSSLLHCSKAEGLILKQGSLNLEFNQKKLP